DIEANLTVTFLESVLGVTRKVKINTKHQCPKCHGSGADSPSDIKTCPRCHGTGVVSTRHRTILGIMESQEYCPDCHGTGKIISKVCSQCHGHKFIEREDFIDLQIKPGVQNGSILRFTNKGNSWETNTGNIDLTIYVQPSRIFKRKDNVLYANVLVDPIDAITGSRIKIPTPHGIKEVDIKSNTANGEEITVSGFGIKDVKHKIFSGNTNGDLVITIVYARPKRYSHSELNKLKEINQSANPDVEDFNKTVSKELS
ncbi:MAG: molecular chaperone DnaJ, partial [Mycoplasmataceae bacterium]|nr:molecular chaperone DnaJ [Mycoplasmataceae bacterium]